MTGTLDVALSGRLRLKAVVLGAPGSSITGLVDMLAVAGTNVTWLLCERVRVLAQTMLWMLWL